MQPPFINSPNTSGDVRRTQDTSSSEISNPNLFPILSVGNTDETPYEDTQPLSENILNKFYYTNVRDELIKIFPAKQYAEIPSNSEAPFVLAPDADLNLMPDTQKNETEVLLLSSTTDHLVTTIDIEEQLKKGDNLPEKLLLKSLLVNIFKKNFSFSEQTLFKMYREEHPLKESYLAFTLSALQATKLCWKIKIRVSYLMHLLHEENYDINREKMTKNSLNTELKELFIYFFRYHQLSKELQSQKIREEINISVKEINKTDKSLTIQIRAIQKQIKDTKRYYNQTLIRRQLTERQLIQKMPLYLTEKKVMQTIKENFTSLSKAEINQIIETIAASVAASITKNQVSNIDNRYNLTLARGFWDLLASNAVKESDFYSKFQQFFFSSWKTDNLLSKQAKKDLAIAKNADDYQKQCVITNARYFRKELKKQAVYLVFQMLKLIEAKVNFQKEKEFRFHLKQKDTLNSINATYKNIYVFVYLPYIARAKQQWAPLNQEQSVASEEIKTLSDLQRKSEALNSRLYSLNHSKLISYASPKQLEFIDKMMTQLHQIGHVTFDVFETLFNKCALDASALTTSNHQLNQKRHGDTFFSVTKKKYIRKPKVSASLSKALPESTSQASVLKFPLPQSAGSRESELKQNSTMIHFATEEQEMEYNESKQTNPCLTNTSFSSQFFEHEGLEEFFDMLPLQPSKFEYE